MRNYAVQESQAVSFRRIEGVGEKQQLFRFGRTGVMSEQPCGPEIAAERDLRIGSAELGLIGGNAQIAGQAHRKSGAHGEAVHGGECHFGHAVQQP